MLQYCQGVWYEIERYANDLDNTGDCVYVETKYKNGKCVLDLREKVNGRNYSLEGEVSLAPNTSTSGLIYYKSPNTTGLLFYFFYFII